MSASKVLSGAVERSADQTSWDFLCPGIAGSPCGADGMPFHSTGWPTKATATARGQQHFDEHKGIAVAQTLEEFRAEQGLGVNEDGQAVSLEDI